jgi:transcription initiation factor TFIIIB Brf1 subunit/transcription initiation factor TFIIB
MRESYWIKPNGEVLYAPQGHVAYIQQHGQEHDLPFGISMEKLILQGWVRVSGDTVLLRQVENAEVLINLQQILLTFGHDVYTFWIGGKPFTVELKQLETTPIMDIYRDILSGSDKYEYPSLYPLTANANDQGIFEYQPSWNEMDGEGSTATKERGVEFMPQDKTKEVWWERDLLDYQKKNFPGKKDVIPPEPDNGFPTQAFDVVERMNKKADHDVQDVVDLGYNLDDLKCRYCGSKEVTFNQGVGDAYCAECGEWQLKPDIDEKTHQWEEQWTKDSQCKKSWRKRSSLRKRAVEDANGKTIKEGDYVKYEGSSGIEPFEGEVVEIYENGIIDVWGYERDKPPLSIEAEEVVIICKKSWRKRSSLRKKAEYSEGCECNGEAYPSYYEDTGELVLKCENCGQEFESDEAQWKDIEKDEETRQWEEQWTKRSMLKQAEEPSVKINKFQAIADRSGPVPISRSGHNAWYKLDESYILHVRYYSTEIVTADMKARKILKVTTGGHYTISTKRRIDDIIRALGYGYPDLVGYEYDATETDADREQQKIKIKENEKARRRNRYREHKLEVPLRKSMSLNTLPEELAELATNEDEQIRRNVARNVSTPPNVLVNMAKDDVAEVRRGVAGNINTPQEVLMELAQTDDVRTRQYIAGNPSTPLEILTMLSKDERYEVRVDVAENPNISIEMLAELGKDGAEDVRDAVKRNPKYESEENRKIRDWEEQWTKKSRLCEKDKMRIALTGNNPQPQIPSISTPPQQSHTQVSPGLGQQHSTPNTSQQTIPDAKPSSDTHNSPKKKDLFKGLHDKHRDSIVFSNVQDTVNISRRVLAWDNPDPSVEDSQTSPMEENMDNRMVDPDGTLYRKRKGRGAPMGDPSEDGELRCNLPASLIGTASDVIERYLINREKQHASEPQIREELENKGIPEEDINNTYKTRGKHLYKEIA